MHDSLDEIDENPGGPGVLGGLERRIALCLADVFHRLSRGLHLSLTAPRSKKHVIGDLTETPDVQKNDVIGALLGVVLPEWLRFAGSLYLIIFAAIVMLLLIACPQGMSGLLERGWNRLTGKKAAR